ncbi:cobyrinate a,c-diamide synthase [Treponema sp.]|uniref:cobyrinate a,c-diamide synthase n=1 Tax=Treponema sp. TaxID=166 RepID=UPI00388D21DC
MNIQNKSQIFNAPRIMIASPSSSSGKTTFTCALLHLLKKRGKNPKAFKTGPDYIDPLFHERVLGVQSDNLDSFFCTEKQINEIFYRNPLKNPDLVSVVEGAMGLFDGLAGKSISASSYDIARITRTPVLLLIDAGGMGHSIVPLIKGFLNYDEKNSGSNENFIRAVFLNKCSKGQFDLLKPQIEEECKIKVIGFLPEDSENSWKSRHLGLILPSEIQNLQEQISKTAQILEETLDFNEFEKIINEWSGNYSDCEQILQNKTYLHKAECSESLKIAVAQDEAFCFYYHENLRFLEESGVKLEFFSPLHDSALPSGIQALLLGGGYPELYAEKLEKNESMRFSVKSAVKNGIPVFAECGGFMYLQEKLVTKEGLSFEMCSAVKGECRYTGKLVRFGYAAFTQNQNPACTVKGHEFHYFDSSNNGEAFTAQKPLSTRSWKCMIQSETMLAGFPHLYYRSCPDLILSNLFQNH